MDLKQVRTDMEQKVASLEAERSSLIPQVAELRERAAIAELESKANMLESELSQLKEEKRMLEERISHPANEGGALQDTYQNV